MTDAAPDTGHVSTIEPLAGGIVVSIPSRRSMAVRVFLIAWMLGWLIGEARVIGQLLPSGPVQETAERFGLVVWLAMWSLGGGIGLVMLLWNIAGRERIVVQDDALSIRMAIFGLGFTRRYELRFVKKLRVLEKAVAARSSPPSSIAEAMDQLDGPLAFDYGIRTVHFGGGVAVPEAVYLLSRLNAQIAPPHATPSPQTDPSPTVSS